MIVARHSLGLFWAPLRFSGISELSCPAGSAFGICDRGWQKLPSSRSKSCLLHRLERRGTLSYPVGKFRSEDQAQMAIIRVGFGLLSSPDERLWP